MRHRHSGRAIGLALVCASCWLASVALAAAPRSRRHRPRHPAPHACASYHKRRRHCRPGASKHTLTQRPSQHSQTPSTNTPTVSVPAATNPITSPPSGELPIHAAETTTPAPRPAPARAQVTAVEYKLTLSRAQVNAGKTTIELIDGGQDEHDLHIRPASGGPDVAAFPTIKPGQHLDQQIELAPGSYTFYCSLPGHEALGMKATFTVTADGSPAALERR
jgi:plastocyanin